MERETGCLVMCECGGGVEGKKRGGKVVEKEREEGEKVEREREREEQGGRL